MNSRHFLLPLLAIVASLTAAPAAVEETMAQPWFAGGDISGLPLLESRGAVYTFDGKAEDLIKATRRSGWNLYRIRLFVNPSKKNLQVNDLAYTLKLAERIRKAGGKFLLDIHYSDTWADPGHQTRPAAWSGLSHQELVQKVEDYSADIITAFQKRGCLPEIVQVGNEINHGMLWPNGKLAGEGAGGWVKLAELLSAGIRGVRRPLRKNEKMEVMLHSASGGLLNPTQHFLANLKKHNVEYDIIGLSYYPWWHGSIADLQKNLQVTAERYGKPIIVVETAYPSRGEGTPGGTTAKNNVWPYTPEGQEKFTRAVTAAVRSTPQGLGRGVLWWYPESIPTQGVNIWLGGRCALFSRDGKSLPSLNALGQSSN